MKRFLIVVLSLTAVISLIISVSNIIFRLERRDRIVTTAEITFIGTPDGSVFGTFTDQNGKVHSEECLYLDGRFQTFLNPVPIKPESYIGKTVRIMYDPSTIDSEGAYTTTNDNGETVTEYRFIETESYDIWLQGTIAAVVIFLVSALSAAVCIFRYKRTKA